ncbi:hypothetical protein Ndes2526B_g04898 [Nannochloris sp. 'desiccata']
MDELEVDAAGPVWSNILYIFEPSSLLLIGTAVGTVAAAALRALRHDVEIHQGGIPHSEGAITLDSRQALAIPLLSSCSLLALFYFFHAIQFLLILLLCIASAVGITFAAHPLLKLLTTARPVLRRRLLLCSRWHVQLGDALLAGFSGISVLSWMLTGSMVLNNLLGICLCISFISFVRLPSLKVTTYLLSALFVYDIFWVFFSEGLFGKNVMVEAATKQAENPAVLVLDALHMPSAGLAQNLDLPVKLVFPGSLLDWDPLKPGLMLGLGDMALPGMLIALLYSEDVFKWQQQCGGSLGTAAKLSLKSRDFWIRSYVLLSICGYTLGMFLALGIGTVFQAAQPALLYLVPCTLSPALVRAARRKELKELWEGWENAGAEGNKTVRKEPDV